MRRLLVVQAVAEALECRQLYTVVYPTAEEQYAVELLNRARANPSAEAARWNGYNDGQGDTYNGDLNEGLAAGTISTAAKQPLAINPMLVSSARGHAQWMVDNDTFSHTSAGGSNPSQREVAAGYTNATTSGENIAVNWSSTSLNQTTTVLNQEEGLFTDQTEAGRGHRTNMMNASFSEVGIGVGTGPWVYPGYGTLNSQDSAQDFASNGTHFLTGVSYQDTVTHDNFYTPGEGLGGVTITATRISDQQVFTTTTWSSGGYSLALPPGTYNIAGSGGGLSATIYYNSVTLGTQNVKKDFVKGQSSDPAPTPPATPPVTPPSTPAAVVVNGTLTLTGTAAADSIGISLKKHYFYTTMNNENLRFSSNLIQHIVINAGAGDDLVALAANVMGASIDGGAGNDTLIGGSGNDSLYGNSGNDLINGNAGDDFLEGGAGNDFIYGGNGDDKIYGLAGNDTVDAGAGNNHVWGGDGNDFLCGAAGKDYLYGDAGADLLNGGQGLDHYTADPLDTRLLMEVLVTS